MLVFARVLPREVAAFPDIDEAVVTLGAFGCRADDFHMLFKAVVFATRVGFGGVG